MSLIVQGEAMAWLLRMLPPHTCIDNEPNSANSVLKRTKSSGGRLVKDLRPLVVDAALIVDSNFAFTMSVLELKSRMLSAVYTPPSLCHKKHTPAVGSWYSPCLRLPLLRLPPSKVAAISPVSSSSSSSSSSMAKQLVLALEALV